MSWQPLSLLYGNEENVPAEWSAYGLLKSSQHQGTDDVADKSRTDYTHDTRGFITSSTAYTYTADANVVTDFEYKHRVASSSRRPITQGA